MAHTSHCFSVELATQIGLREAIILQHLYWWHEHNAALANMNIDGRVWFYIPVTQIAEVFPYLSEKVVRGILDKLIDADYLLKDHKGEGQQKFNRTNWYAFTEAGLVFFELPNGETPFAPEGKSIVSNYNYINNYNTKKENPKEKSTIVLPYSSVEFADTWAMLVSQPKWRGKSRDALAKCAKMLAGYPERIAIEMMNASIRNGWQGLFPLKSNEIGKTSSAQSRAHDARVAAEERLAATLAEEGVALIEGGAVL